MSKFQLGRMDLPDNTIEAFKDYAKRTRRPLTKAMETLLIKTMETIEKNKEEYPHEV